MFITPVSSPPSSRSNSRPPTRQKTFDGLPSVSRRRPDGATEIFYQEGTVDVDDPTCGYAVIKDGKLVYKKRPNESRPVIDK
jgi:hypothetical protein